MSCEREELIDRKPVLSVFSRLAYLRVRDHRYHCLPRLTWVAAAR